MSLPVPTIEKRPRDAATEDLIKQALEEEQQRKRLKKGHAPPPGRKGQTLAELEEAEGGPVKESKVSMAHTKRALARKGKGKVVDEDTGLPVEVEAVEEEGPDQEALEDLLGPAATALAAGAGGPLEPGAGEHPGGRRAAADTASDGDSVMAEGAALEGAEPAGGKDDDGAAATAAEAAARRAREKGFDPEDLGPGATGGYGVTAFNLKSEREEGYFDEEGNYVFKADDDPDAAGDAWLASEGAKPVSDKVRAAAEAQAAAATAADEAPQLSETQVAVAQRELAGLLQPGETVTKALRRLGAVGNKGRALSKRDKQKALEAAAAAAAAAGGSQAPDASAAAAAFSRITELADLLVSAGGELESYSHSKEQLQRWSDAILPAAPPPGAAAAAAAGDDDEDDMFASDDEAAAKGVRAPGKKEPAAALTAGAAAGAAEAASSKPASAAPAAAPPAPAQAAAAAAAGAGDSGTVDYSSWPIKELRRFCTERGTDTANIVEKSELVAKVKELAARGPEGEPGAAAATPAGYTHDPASGFYFNPETNLYWDAKTGGFYSGADGKWYSWDECTGQFVAWQQ